MLVGFLALLGESGVLAAEAAGVLDDFTDATRWEKVAAEGVEITCSTEKAADQSSSHPTPLRMDVNFVSGGGYAGIRRKLPLDLPKNFEIGFSLRGDLPPNNLEFKLLDESGQNVWWVNRRSYEFSKEWTRLGSRRRHFQFAWGPSAQPLQKISAIEIVVASAQGGRGSVWLDDFTLRELPETKPYAGTPTLTASSTADATSTADLAMDNQANTAWRSAVGEAKPVLTVDFGQAREFGGIAVEWDTSAFAPTYEVQFSDDGQAWNTVRRVTRNSGCTQYVSLPDAEARAVRLVMEGAGAGKHVAIREIRVLPLEASQNPNAFAQVIARESPKGHYPRAIGGEGTFWTIVGVPADEHEALVSEDGAVEVDKQAFSVEPFLEIDGKLLTWADAETSQSLAEGFAPVPTVTRDHQGLQLSITAAADGKAGASSLLLLYKVTNTGGAPRRGSLLLAVRPFQVNPPYQSLNTIGGVSRIEHLELTGKSLVVDNRQMALGATPDAWGAASFEEGDIVAFLSDGQLPPSAKVTDPQRGASGALRYGFQLAPGESQAWVACVPLGVDSRGQQDLLQPFLTASDKVKQIVDRQAAAVEKWRAATTTFDLLVPASANDLVNTIRSTLGYILINQDGRAIHPGSRSYERSWIRDGSLTATALLRFGMEREAREFVDWYAPYQFDSGKVPCVVDHRGPDPVPENDSHGQLIMAVMNVYRFTGDREFLERNWPHVQRAVDYIESLRVERMTGQYADPYTTAMHQEPGKPAVSLQAFCGLMPESISHEGYSAKPMHSYWDDFFVLKGLKDAAEMAQILDDQETATRYQALADDFARTLYASIALVMKTHQIDYLPGCVELGDFDATSTTVALWPCGERARLPQPALDRTFQKYWDRFVSRRDDPAFAWVDYTPYELRVIGSLVLLDQPDRARQAMEFFLQDRRPLAWNQWPEVVYREPRTARFLGDLPHTWCGSDFVNSVRMMFLYERETDQATVLLAGVPAEWLSTEPIGFRNQPTYGGRLTCTLQQSAGDPQRLLAHLEGDCPLPSGGLRLTLPGGTKASQVAINGTPGEIDDDGRIVVRALPAEVEIGR
jgi:hypothetical protein